MGASQTRTQAIAATAQPALACPSGISPFVTLGAGCYWGTEKFVRKDFQKRFPNSVKSSAVGFMSPDPASATKRSPSYRQVCSGSTGFVEVLDLELVDPSSTYEELVRFFFMFHDPTTRDAQGNDRGSQYASVIFAHDDAQLAVANRVKKELQASVSDGTIVVYDGPRVVTDIIKATKFFPAEEDHQDYLAKNPGGCKRQTPTPAPPRNTEHC